MYAADVGGDDDNADLMLLRYLDRVIFPLPVDCHLSRCDVLWSFYCQQWWLVHQSQQQHMTHCVIDMTLAHVHVIDYVHLCAVHLVRCRVPLDLLMDSTDIKRMVNKKKKMKRKQQQQEHSNG